MNIIVRPRMMNVNITKSTINHLSYSLQKFSKIQEIPAIFGHKYLHICYFSIPLTSKDFDFSFDLSSCFILSSFYLDAVLFSS